MTETTYGDVSWDRMIRAVERVRERLLRATSALDAAGIPYAVAGGNAVAAWVSRVDESAVRNTQDVDLVLRRSDWPAAARALEGAGFIRRRAAGVETFLDGPDAKARDAIHLVAAGEKIRPHDILAAPDVVESEPTSLFRLLSLEALVRMKLTSFRDKDRTHLRDMIDVGIVGASWCGKFPGVLAGRLQQLLDDPEG